MNCYTLTYRFKLTPKSSYQGKIDIFANDAKDAQKQALASIRRIAPPFGDSAVIEKVERKS